MNPKEMCKLAFLLIFIVFVFVFSQQRKKAAQQVPDEAYIKQYELQKDMAELQKIVDNATGRGVVVYDFNTDTVLASKNTDTVYPLASLTKIITATLVYQKNKGSLDEIRHMLKVSSNEDAEKLAEIFGTDEATKVAYMNAMTKPYNMHFRNASGLDTEDGLPGGSAKPLDLIHFIKDYYPQYPELFDQTIEQDGNTNVIVDNLNFLSAGKTGFTDLAGGNLFVSVQKGLGREIFILVLNSTEKNRFVDVQNIANFLLQSSI